MLMPNALPLSSGGNADTIIAIEVTLIKASEIPKINLQARNCSCVVTRTLTTEIIINKTMLIFVTFLRPNLAEIWPAGTDRTATTNKNIIVTQF